MTRVLSGAVLVAIAVAVVWFAPPAVFFAVAEALLILAFVEYGALAAACGLPIPMVASGAGTVAASIGVTSSFWVEDRMMANAVALDAALLSAFVVLAAMSLVTSSQGGQGGKKTRWDSRRRRSFQCSISACPSGRWSPCAAFAAAGRCSSCF